jgi:hypothetical protein
MASRVSGSNTTQPQSGQISPPSAPPVSGIAINVGGSVISQNGSDGSVKIYTTSSIGLFASTVTVTSNKIIMSSAANVGNEINNPGGLGYDPGSGLNAANGFYLDGFNGTTLYSTKAERQLAGTYFTGGVGIEQDLSVGGFIYGRISKASTATTSTFITVSTTNNTSTYYPLFTDAAGFVSPGATLYGDLIGNKGGLTYVPSSGLLVSDRGSIAASDNSTGSTTGAFTVTGGVGIAKDVWIGGDVQPDVNNKQNIGSDGHAWANAYLEKVYSKFVGNTNSNITISPNNGITNPLRGTGGVMDVYGDIRVRGDNPVGTAPVVTNILYVTTDGDDTNDGRAMDASRACRTISGAINSPYYQSGTQIRVAPGLYLENNPIQLKPYTSIMGSDLRTTSIEPINKTQDLFHMNSGCYLAFMQFLNGRSGLLPGTYANGYNRGAYATAFPPLPVGEQIDLFHSPYIQNCTNLTGPWLNDGKMFVPAEVVQVPIITGMGSWEANTTTIVINVLNEPVNGFINAGKPNSNDTQYTGNLQSTLNIITTQTVKTSSALNTITNLTLLNAYQMQDTGDLWVYTGADTITLGMSIDTGHQNSGFFDARTLMLANQAFLQWQVVSFIDQTFNPGTFTYNTATCYRDVGLIVDAISMDMLYDSTSDSTFAGLQYWSQTANGYTGNIPGEITATIAAITFLKGIAQGVVSTGNRPTVNTLFNTLTNILSAGNTNGVTNLINYGGLPSTSPTTIYDFQQLTDPVNVKSMQTQVFNYITTNYPTLAYTSSTCMRDVGYIIDSVAFDLLHGSNVQTIKSGVYYYGYTSNQSAIANEIPQTSAAYSYIQSIIPYIITNQPVPTVYSTGTQVFNNLPATDAEINTLQNKIDVITRIIVDGPAVADAKTPINLKENTTPSVLNAWNLLHANRTFIQKEVVAFVNSQFSTFTYNKQLSYRDTGILIQNVAYDATFGGNSQSVEAGLAYWNGVISYITGQIPQCVAAVEYLNNLVQAVIRNIPCPVLPQVVGIPVNYQVINTVLTNGEIASQSIDNLFGIIKNVMKEGPSVAPSVYYSTGPDAAFVSSEILMHLNRPFIQENTLNYINYNLSYPKPSLPFNKIKCARDTAIIIDSIASDLLFPTSSVSQTTFAGLQYFNQAGYIGNIATEITTTTAAMVYLKELAAKIVSNTTYVDDALVGITRYASTATQRTQVTNINPTTSDVVSKINNEFDIIISILKGSTKGWTDKIIPNGGRPSNLKSVQDAYALLLANLSYIQAEVYAYVVSPQGLNYASTNFTTSTCIRDVGYIIDSVAFDVLHGGNRQAIQSGLSYYSQNPSDTLIPNETTATAAAFSFLGTLMGQLITDPNPVVITYQSDVKQVVGLPVATSAESTQIQTVIVSTLTNILTSGPVGYNYTPISLTTSSNANVYLAYDIIEANKEFLVAETLAWIDYTYNTVSSFTYNQTKCSRDTGLIVDAIGMDLLYGSSSDSTFAGLQYWNQDIGYTGNIPGEITATIAAFTYLKGIAASFVSSGNTSTVTSLFNNVINILNNSPVGVTDTIVFGGLPNSGKVADYNALQANKLSMENSVIAYLTTNFPSLAYDPTTCRRDVGYVIDAVSFDLYHGGNIQSIKSGVYYYGYDGNSTAINNEIPATTAAYNYISSILPYIVTGQPVLNPYQLGVPQSTSGTPGTAAEVDFLKNKIDVITNIILNGPAAAESKSPQRLIPNNDPYAINAWTLLNANRAFIQAEVIAYINSTSIKPAFAYNQEKCFRDVGLMVDAVSQDILLGGNQRSIEAGLSYWTQGYNYIANQVSTTTAAIKYISDICLQIIANKPVDVVTGTVAKQVINPFFQYGDDYMPQQAVARNFNIISEIINRGPQAAPPLYAGGGIIALTGLNGADVKLAPTVTYISTISTGTYLIGLSTATVGFGNNATLYFGDVEVFPLQDAEVETIALRQTGSSSSWDQRKVDAIGGMGGSLVDGAVVSARSPIQSFVYDAFTQLTQGGVGVKVTNNGYAQLVSVFTIFCSIAVEVDNGGIASITNSNCNFGTLGLVAKGYGKRAFSGTIFNPKNRAYPFSPDVPGSQGLDPYYPAGYFPSSTGGVEVFVPDLNNRPHISLVMEIVPPVTYSNPLNSPAYAAIGLTLQGFLVAKPSIATLSVGAITIENIDNTDVAIGHTLYIIDQFGYPYDNFQYLHDEFGNYVDSNNRITTNPADYIVNPNYKIWYAGTGTQVVDIGFNSVTINQSLGAGGGFADDPNYFNLYFCGNSYYTVQTSSIANQPYQTGTNILSANTNPYFQGPTQSQITQHVDSISYLGYMVDQIINNQTYIGQYSSLSAVTVPNITSAVGSKAFIDLRFGYLTSIIGSSNINIAESVVPAKKITTSGTVPSGAGSAITLIRANIEFLSSEIYAYVQSAYPTLLDTSSKTGQEAKCRRDVGLILQQLIYDLETGGNYNMVHAGLSYWSRPGSYHIVQLGEAVTDPSIFPDGAIVNFYQRSYISASGYLFEYVGAGANYGALPQYGKADPQQQYEAIQLNYGKVFYTSTDQNGDFRIGPGLVISQATGVIAGRTFTQSLFANMTPFILAIQL